MVAYFVNIILDVVKASGSDVGAVPYQLLRDHDLGDHRMCKSI